MKFKDFTIEQSKIFKGVDWIIYGGSEEQGNKFCRPATYIEINLSKELGEAYNKLKKLGDELNYIKKLHGK